MANALEAIGLVISMWWGFMLDTNVPGTNFSFAALWLFVLVITVFTGVVGIAAHKNNEKKE